MYLENIIFLSKIISKNLSQQFQNLIKSIFFMPKNGYIKQFYLLIYHTKKKGTCVFYIF